MQGVGGIGVDAKHGTAAELYWEKAKSPSSAIAERHAENGYLPHSNYDNTLAARTLRDLLRSGKVGVGDVDEAMHRMFLALRETSSVFAKADPTKAIPAAALGLFAESRNPALPLEDPRGSFRTDFGSISFRIDGVEPPTKAETEAAFKAAVGKAALISDAKVWVDNKTKGIVVSVVPDKGDPSTLRISRNGSSVEYEVGVQPGATHSVLDLVAEAVRADVSARGGDGVRVVLVDGGGHEAARGQVVDLMSQIAAKGVDVSLASVFGHAYSRLPGEDGVQRGLHDAAIVKAARDAAAPGSLGSLKAYVAAGAKAVEMLSTPIGVEEVVRAVSPAMLPERGRTDWEAKAAEILADVTPLHVRHAEEVELYRKVAMRFASAGKAFAGAEGKVGLEGVDLSPTDFKARAKELAVRQLDVMDLVESMDAGQHAAFKACMDEFKTNLDTAWIAADARREPILEDDRGRPMDVHYNPSYSSMIEVRNVAAAWAVSPERSPVRQVAALRLAMELGRLRETLPRGTEPGEVAGHWVSAAGRCGFGGTLGRAVAEGRTAMSRPEVVMEALRGMAAKHRIVAPGVAACRKAEESMPARRGFDPNRMNRIAGAATKQISGRGPTGPGM